jgi:sulfur-oxidizing protein SoxX
MSAAASREEINAPDAMRQCMRMRPAAVTYFAVLSAVVSTALAAANSGGANAQPAPNEARPLITIVDDGIPAPLANFVGDVERGKKIVASRQESLCVLCHQLPPELGIPAAFQGNIAPSIAGTGSRWSAAQLRMRLVDSRRLNPYSVMPSYYRVDGLTQVGAAWRSRSILNAQQIEDVVAYLLTLK